MIDIENNIIPLIEGQFPAFYEEEGPLFVLFVKEYYEWLNTQTYNIDGVNVAGGAIYQSRSLPNYRDIDKTADEYLVHFKEKYLKNINFNSESNRRTLIKAAHDLFASKGSELSIELLFNLLYGIGVQVYTPGDAVFKCSNARWTIPKYLEVLPTYKSPLLAGQQIIGSRSGATAFVEYVITRQINGRFIDLLFLSSIDGLFLVDDVVSTDGIIADSPTVTGSFNSIDITQAGDGFVVGEEVNIVSASGVEGRAFVTSIEAVTGIVQFALNDGGWGFSTSSNTLVSQSSLLLTNIINANTEITSFTKFEFVEQNNFSLALSNITGSLSTGNILATPEGSLSVVLRVDPGANPNTATVLINPVSGTTFSNSIMFSPNSAYVYVDRTLGFTQGNVVKQNNGTSDNARGAVKSTANVVVLNINSAVTAANGIHVGTFVIQATTLATGRVVAINREANFVFTAVNAIAVSVSTGTFSGTDAINMYADAAGISYLSVATPTSIINARQLELEAVTGLWSAGNTIISESASAITGTTLLASAVGGKFTSNTQYLSTGQIIGSNTSAIGIILESNTFFGTGLSTIRGLTSNTYANVYQVSTGSSADFQVGFISDSETVLLSPDLLNGNNQGPNGPDTLPSVPWASMLISGANSSYNNLHSVYIESGGTGYSNTDTVVLTSGRNINAASLTYTVGAFLSNTFISPLELTPSGIFFKYTGTEMYLVGTTSDKIHQFTLSTPWAVNTATYTANVSVNPQGANHQDVFISSDGKFVYTVESSSDRVHQYTMATPWSIATTAFTRTFQLSAAYQALESGTVGMTFKPDGTSFYLIGSAGDTIVQFDLSVAWDISTAFQSSKSLYVNPIETNPGALRITEDGTRFILIGTTGDRAHVYNLTTPWDISTGVFVGSSSTWATLGAGQAVPQSETGATGFYIKPTGDKLYVIGTAIDTVAEYNVANAGVVPLSNATIITNASGVITACTLGASKGGANIFSTPIATVLNSSGGASTGSAASLIPVSSLGFPKYALGDITFTILDLLRFNTRTIGTIASLTAINPGENYNLDPFVLVREDLVAAYGKRDYIMNITNLSKGTGFTPNELVTQSSGTPALTLLSSAFVYNNYGPTLSSIVTAASTNILLVATVAASNTITGASLTSAVIQPGMYVSGTGIPTNTYVVSVSSGVSAVLSNAATASSAATAPGTITITTSGTVIFGAALTTAAIEPGMYVYGTGIPNGALIISINTGVSAVISLPATASGTITLTTAYGIVRNAYEVGEFITTNNGISITGTGTVYSTTASGGVTTTVLTSNTGTFNSTISTSKLAVSTNVGFSVGDAVTQSGGGSGTVLVTNTSTMIIRNVTGTFAISGNKITGTGTANANITAVTSAFNVYQMSGSTSKGLTNISGYSACTASSVATGRIKNLSNTSTLFIKRTSLFDEFINNGGTLVGEISGETATVVFSAPDTSSDIIGLNANITANVITTTGSITDLTLVDSGISFYQDQGATFSSLDGARVGAGKINLGGIGSGSGRYTTFSGILDDVNYIHDGEYYQEYSYEVQSNKPLDTYYNVLKQLLHVAGTKMFGRVVTSSTSIIGTDIVQSSKTIELTP